jgi:hypothetical protein
MGKKSVRLAVDAVQRATKWNLFGPPPLLEGEDPAAYDELAARVFSAVQPTDFI